MPTPNPADRDVRPESVSFEALFRSHHAALCTFAYRYVLARDVAEELVQEVFLYLWEREMRWEEDAVAKSYLYSAVRNAALSYLRHQGVVRRVESEIVALYANRALPADREQRAAELGEALQRAIARLPERRRLVFTMSREQGLTYDQIAELLGISIKTVEMQMGRAYKSLRQWLGPYWP